MTAIVTGIKHVLRQEILGEEVFNFLPDSEENAFQFLSTGLAAVKHTTFTVSQRTMSRQHIFGADGPQHKSVVLQVQVSLQ